MKTFLSTPLRREFFFFVALPFLLWVFCFRDFLSGRAPLTVDAISYYEHITFFTNNIIHGVYPLWNPSWCDGAPYNFFLRRMGDANPFFWLVGGLKAFGLADMQAYLVFLASYYFLAVTGFWLTARALFHDRLTSSAAFLLLLFSGWSSQIFFNYIVILFVPVVWFFYFLISFGREWKKHQFIGIFFTTGLILTTYIPFFALMVIGLFLALFPFFFRQQAAAFLRGLVPFLRSNRVVAGLCLAFLVLACVPAVDFYRESKQGEFVMPGRHEGAAAASAVAVAMKRVKDGDILAQGYFDKIFMDHPSLVPGDFFISYFFFLACLISVITPLTRRAGFLLANAFILGLISMTETSPLYGFLYDHVFFFRYMRMLSYLFWIGVLPMLILLVMGQLRLFMDQYRAGNDRRVLAFVIIAHALFGAWALMREGVSWTAWAVVLLSGVFFTGLVTGRGNRNVLGGVLLAAVLVQPLEMAYYLAQNAKPKAPPAAAPAADPRKGFELRRDFVPAPEQQDTKDVFLLQLQRQPYYASRWYTDVFVYVPENDLGRFRSHKLYLFDNTVPYGETSPEFFRKLGAMWRSGANAAALPQGVALPDDLRSSAHAGPRAQPVDEGSHSVQVLAADANTLSLRTRLEQPKFLLWTDSYHPGWHAFINGKETRVLRANHAFKGVWVPAGENRLVFRFATPWRYAGAYAMLAVFGAALAALVFFASREGLCAGREGQHAL